MAICAGLSPALVGSRLISLKLWPHRFSGTFYFASIRHEFEREPTRGQGAAIHLAPRIPGVVAAVAFPFALLLPSPWCWFMSALLGAALIDIAVGSIGWSDRSDAKRATAALRVSPGGFGSSAGESS